MANLNSNERLQLKKLVDESECENNTETIRTLKYSVFIRNDIRAIDTLRNTSKNMPDEEFKEICQTAAPFLFTNYTDIFNRMVKGELDLTIMTKLLTILKLIEDAKVDQHEGSVMFGKILKELYLDSAVRTADNLDKKYADESAVANAGADMPEPEKPISWKQYKQQSKC